jgi:hypothetical protein
MSALLSNWRLFNAIAIVASLAHVLIDFHIGLFGATSKLMSVPEAASVFATALAYGGWGYALATANAQDKSRLASLFAYVVFWSFLANGVIAVLIVPPPSAAFPYQDIAHVSNVIFGGLGAYATWKALEASPGNLMWAAPRLHIGLLLLAYIGQNAVYFLK